MIIILDPEIEFLLCIFHVVEGVQINAFVFQGTPQPLDKDIVHPATFAVHRGLDVVRLEFVDPGSGRLPGRCEMRTLSARCGPA